MVFRCSFSGELWKYGGDSSWWFICLPVEDAEDIERFCSHRKRNFGSIRVNVTIGETSWQTSLFRDTKSNSYLLPVKAAIRRKEEMVEHTVYEVMITVD